MPTHQPAIASRSSIEAVISSVIGKPVTFYDIALVPVGSSGYFSPSGVKATLDSNGWIRNSGQKYSTERELAFTSHRGPANNAQILDVVLEHFTIIHKEPVEIPLAIETKPQVITQHFDIWTEGYASNEGSGIAEKVNRQPIEAASFDEAVASYVAGLSSSDRGWWVRSPEGKWSMWGCQAFPDQQSAQESFG